MRPPIGKRCSALRRTPHRHRARATLTHAVPDAPADRRARQPGFYSDIGGLDHRRTDRSTRASRIRGRYARAAGRYPRTLPKGTARASTASPRSTTSAANSARCNSTSRAVAPPDGPERLGGCGHHPVCRAGTRPRKHLDLTRLPRAERADRDRRPLPGRRGPGRHPQHRGDDGRRFPEDPNRINVAISRAQDLLIVTTTFPPRSRAGSASPSSTSPLHRRARPEPDPAYHVLHSRRRASG